MAILRIGTTSTQATTNDQTKTSLALAHDATPAVGDTVIIEAAVTAPGTGTTNDFTTPTGWTLVGTVFEAGTPSLRLSVFRKTWASGNTLPTLTWTLAANAVAFVKVRRNVDTTTPIHKVSVSPHAGTAGARATGSITTTLASVIEYGFADRSGSTFTVDTTTDDTLASSLLPSSVSAIDYAIPGVPAAGTYARTATATAATSIGASWIYALTPGATSTKQGPTSRISAPATVDPNLVDTFVVDGTGSTDPDGTIATYQLSEIGPDGLGTLIPGAGPTWTLPVVRGMADAVRYFALTVTDNDGLINTATTTVTTKAHRRRMCIGPGQWVPLRRAL